MAKSWKLKKQYTKDFAKNFPREDDLVLQLLFERGIKTPEERDKYFKPENAYDPFLMKGMETAVERILKAVENNEKIFIFGDYDADGICGTVILVEFFEKIGFDNFDVYNPDRNLEGHGLREKSLEEIKAKKPNLVITVDNGITSFEEVEELNKAGVETIITDHHMVPEKLPPAVAVVDVKQSGDEYPFKELCGTAVAFKLVQALVQKGGFDLENGWEKVAFLDLVAIATIADMMPLEDENRSIVYWGLEVLKKSKRPGLKGLFAKLKIDQANISADDVAFFIAPRLNAASRMDHASVGVGLLRSKTKEEIEWLLGRLDQANADRRGAVDEILAFARGKFSKEEVPAVIIVGNKDWQPGVVGLAATRLVEEFSRPAFVWGRGEGEYIKGSCRSDGSVNLVELMRMLPEELYNDFGGHPMAGGFTLNGDVIEEFSRQILENYKKAPKADEEELMLDKELGLDKVNWDTYKLVERFEPFGQANPKPVFWFKNLEVQSVRKFGNGGAHLQFSFLKPDNNFVNAIGFWTKNHSDPIKKGDRIDLAASFEKNTYNGYDELRLRMVDFRRAK